MKAGVIELGFATEKGLSQLSAIYIRRKVMLWWYKSLSEKYIFQTSSVGSIFWNNPHILLLQTRNLLAL